MRLVQRLGHRTTLRRAIQNSDWGQNRIHLAQDTIFVRMQRLSHGTAHPTPPKTEVKERLELYIYYYSSSGPSQHVLR